MQRPQVTLEQWQIFKIVIEQGSFQGAADKLIKSQSTVSYAIQKMQENLGVQLFKQKGRRAVLTQVGKQILKRADELLIQAIAIERLAEEYSAGWEPVLRIMTTQLLPHKVLTDALSLFAEQCTITNIDFQQGSLSGVTDAIVFGTADLIITSKIPTGFSGERLLNVKMSRFVHYQHPLTQVDGPLTTIDLKQHAQIVMGDSGSRRNVDAGWLGSKQHWRVKSFDESLNLIKNGLGHGNLPVGRVQEEITNGELVALEIEDQPPFDLDLYLVYKNRDILGPGGQLFADQIKLISKSFYVS